MLEYEYFVESGKVNSLYLNVIFHTPTFSFIKQQERKRNKLKPNTVSNYEH